MPGNAPAQPLLSVAIGLHHVFIGTWGAGVLRAPRDAPPFRLLTQLGAGGLRNINITAVMADGEVGRPWVGSFGGGPQRVDVTAGTSIDPVVGSADDPITVAGVVSLGQLASRAAVCGRHRRPCSVSTPTVAMSHWTGTTAGRSESIGPGYVAALLPGDTGRPVGGRRRQRPAPARRRRTLSRVPP